MAFTARKQAPSFPPESGMQRATIGEWVVDFPTGQQPTLEQVQAQAQPSAVQITQADRAAAKTAVSADHGPQGKSLRAIADAARDSDNAIRSWITQYKAAVAASSSLADLKTRVAALPNLPPITTQTVLAAILARIDDGTVD